jgi:hypothetical protein
MSKQSRKLKGVAGRQRHGLQTPRATGAGQPRPEQRRRFPKLVLILLVIAVTTGVAFAAFEFLLPGRVPPELVRQWRVVGGPMDGTIFEFQRNGGMIGRKSLGDNEGLIEGKALVTDKTLRTTTINPFTRKAETGTQTIVTLTETEFVTEDQKGTRVTMVRAR